MQTVLSPGQRLRNITIESFIGQGGQGSVWKGRVDIVDMQVAIKVMNPELAANEQSQQRFLREARAMASLHHDRIVPLNDFFHDETTGLLVLVMPFMEGQSLEALLTAYPQGLPIDTALKYAGDALSALAFAHEHDVVHRDVKTSNMLVTKEDKAYLMDFGIAKVLTSARLTQSGGGMFGTLEYMSPEQIRAIDQLDGRSDIYSLGCVLYEMLSGVLPFNPAPGQADRMVALMNAHLHEEARPLRTLNPSVPEELAGIVAKAMAKDRDARFTDCREFAKALNRVRLSHEGSPAGPRRTVVETPGPAAAPKRSPVEEAPLPPRQSNRLVKVAGGAVLAAALAAGAWVVLGPKSQAGAGVPSQQITVEPEPGLSPNTDLSNAPRQQNQTQSPVVAPQGSAPVDKPSEGRQVPEAVSPQVQRGQQAAQESADLEAKGPGNYCSALERMNEAVRLSPQNDSYRTDAQRLKSFCDIYH